MPTTTPAATASRERDPLRHLGSDLFHDVLSLLPLPNLLVAERVCKRWQFFSHTNGALWRNMCLREKVHATDLAACDAQGRQTRRAPSADTPYRALCLTLLPHQRAWEAGEAHYRSLRYPNTKKAVPALVAFVGPDLYVRNVDNSLTLNTLTHRIDMHEGVATYHHLQACGDYIVGMTTSNRFEAVSPKPPPTRIEIWQVVRPPGRPVLQFVRVLRTPPIWGHALRLHEEVRNGRRSLAIAVLAAEVRVSGENPHHHWVAYPYWRNIRLWHLDWENPQRAPEHEIIRIGQTGPVHCIEFDDEHVFLPSPTALYVCSRATRDLVVCIPSPPQKAALAFGIEPPMCVPSSDELHWTHPPPATVVPAAGALPGTEAFWVATDLARQQHRDARSDEHARCRRTTNDLVITSSYGALIILRNYRAVLRSLMTMDPQRRQFAVCKHIFILATYFPIVDLATYRDRIAFRMSYRGEMMITLDTSTFPTLSTNPGTSQLGGTSTARVENARWDDGPKAENTILSRRFVHNRHPDANIVNSMYMDGTGVYYCTIGFIRAHFYAQNFDPDRFPEARM